MEKQREPDSRQEQFPNLVGGNVIAASTPNTAQSGLLFVRSARAAEAPIQAIIPPLPPARLKEPGCRAGERRRP